MWGMSSAERERRMFEDMEHENELRREEKLRSYADDIAFYRDRPDMCQPYDIDMTYAQAEADGFDADEIDEMIKEMFG